MGLSESDEVTVLITGTEVPIICTVRNNLGLRKCERTGEVTLLVR